MQEFLRLKKSNCKNCYKCIRSCPVKSIRFSGNQAHIVTDECVLCGQCFVMCPQNAKEITDDTEKAKVLLYSGPVVASLAPSFIANYPGMDIADMEAALKRLGFAAAEETAIGATYVKNEYDRIMDQSEQSVCISSCCSTINLLVRKYYPEALPYLARVISPMQAHAVDIKKRYPDAKVVFIGPCISKKAEAEEYGGVDCVLTFEELSAWLEREDIALAHAQRPKDQMSRARLFPTTGGILKTMACKTPDCAYLAIDGMSNCIHALEDVVSGKISKCFIEMSACTGSCIGGPAMNKQHKNPVGDYLDIASAAGVQDFPIGEMPNGEIGKNHPYMGFERNIPGNDTIQEILRNMGKTKPEDELNCGSCGYNTCREKAIAVFQGKADLSMCLPFLKDKAESFSDTIISNTPNGILVLNERLEVQQINKAALRIMNIRNASDVLGEPVVRVMDPLLFLNVQKSGSNIRDKRVYLAEYQKYIEETIIHDRSYNILICIMRDITVEEKQRQKKESISHQTVEVTDRVVEKQMRVVQEVASLLGETVAETKIALTKLKESLTDE